MIKLAMTHSYAEPNESIQSPSVLSLHFNIIASSALIDFQVVSFLQVSP
jgi:hypothetical protein